MLMNSLAILLIASHTVGDEGGGEGGGDAGGGDPAGGDAGGGDPAGGDLGGDPAGGDAGGDAGGAQEFNWSSWDGNESSIPAERKAEFDNINRVRQKSANEGLRQQLVQGLKSRHSNQRQRQIQAQQNRQRQNAENADKPLTQAEFDKRIADQQRQNQLDERTNRFREGMLEVAGGVHNFGKASISFNSQEELNQFESFMQDRFNNGLTPMDMLKLYRFDAILKGHGDGVIRGHEKTITNRRAKMKTGENINKPGPVHKPGAPVGNGRVPSMEEFIRQENPAALKAINAGELSVLENI